MLHLLLVGLAVASGIATVLQRDILHQAILLGLHGSLLALVLLVLRAPDVALAQIAVGSVAVPLMFLAAIANARRYGASEDEAEEGSGAPGSGGGGEVER